MNKFRNEMEIKLGLEKILLRPTFENIAATETHVGGLAFLAWKFSIGSRGGAGMLEMAKSLPTLTECAAIIFYNQAATKENDATKKKFSLEEIWEFVQAEGMKDVIHNITMYLARITAGSVKVDELDKMSEAEKKS